MPDIPYWQQRQQLKLKGTSRLAGEKAPLKESQKEESSENEDKKTPKAPSFPSGKKAKNKGIKRTKKLAKTMRNLKINYGPYLEKHPICAILSPVCTTKSTVVNHKAGRGVTAVLDKKTWEPSCQNCNDFIEAHHQWAVDNGHKTTRLAKPDKFKDAGI